MKKEIKYGKTLHVDDDSIFELNGQKYYLEVYELDGIKKVLIIEVID